MVRVDVLTLIATPAPQPSILVLQPTEEEVSEGVSRVIPIFVGTVEAMGLGAALESLRFERPMTHDLFLDVMTNLDATIDHVLINKFKGRTFYSEMVLSQHGRLISIDARPSDSVALAIRQQAPIYIEEDILERASFPYIRRPSHEDESVDEEQIMAQFKDFIDTISPDDFVG